MPWFRLDDSFHSHPKVIAAGNEAVGLYVRCGTYAAQHLTDGHIPEQVALQYGTPALAETLVRTKLWRRARGGYKMPDFLDYNPSKEAVQNQRKTNAQRQSRWRERQGNGVTNTVTNSAPSRPDPSVVSVVTEGARASPPRAQKPGSSSSSLNGAASRHPSAIPFAEAMEAALHPEGRGRHARQEQP